MKKYFSMAIMAAAMLTACDESATTGGGGNDSTPLTPEENRSKLEEIALEAINLASPDKQADLIQIIDEFAKLTDEYYPNFRYDESDPNTRVLTPAAVANSLLKPIRTFAETAKPSALTKATYEDNYYYEAKRAYGIYEFNSATKEWNYTASSDRFQMVFPYENTPVTLTVTTSGQEYSHSVVDEGTYNEYDPTTGTYNTVSYKDTYHITVPAKVEASVVWGAKEMLNVTVEGEYNEGTGPVNQTFKMEMGVYDFSRTINLTNSQLSMTEDFNIDGKDFLGYNVTVTGKNLCDVDTYADIDMPEDIFTGATVRCSVLDLNIDAETAANIKDAITEYRGLDDKYPWVDNPDILEPDSNLPPARYSQKYVEDECRLINDYTSVTASYGNDSPFADLRAKARYTTNVGFSDKYLYTYEYGSYYTSDWRTTSGYELDFIIKFRNDGAEFLITDYFNEDDFTSVTDAADRLIERYEHYMDYLLAY